MIVLIPGGRATVPAMLEGCGVVEVVEISFAIDVHAIHHSSHRIQPRRAYIDRANGYRQAKSLKCRPMVSALPQLQKRLTRSLRSARRTQIPQPRRTKAASYVLLKIWTPDRWLFALVLAWTGARVSEVLALTPASFQIDTGVVVIVTLKRRKFAVREVPIPPPLMKRLDRCFALRRLQQGEHSAQQRLWPWHRATAWRLIKHVMLVAGVCGRQACPRGLRHGLGVGALQSGVPLHLIQRWMGHALLTTTAIYMNVCGSEEIGFARHFWRVLAAQRFRHFHQPMLDRSRRNLCIRL